jgi:hypothetical protein
MYDKNTQCYTLFSTTNLMAKNYQDYKFTFLLKYRVRHKSANTPLSHEHLGFQGWIQDGGRGTRVARFVQLCNRPFVG